MMRAEPFLCAALSFEPLDREDWELLRTWRNHERVRRELFNAAEVTAEEHQLWCETRDEETDHVFMVRDLLTHELFASVSLYNIRYHESTADFGRLMIGNENYLGKRLGTVITFAMLDYAFRKLGLQSVELAVRNTNERAQRAYAAAGFVAVASTERDKLHMVANAPEARAWQKWDAGNATELIEQAWKSADEQHHRKWLAANILGRVPPAETIMEFGCGSGEVYAALDEAGFNTDDYTGLDVSYRMLAFAQRKHPEGWFQYGDLFQARREDADNVVCAEVLGHLPNAERALETLCESARQRVIISAWTGEKDTVTAERIGDLEFLHHVYAKRDLICALRKHARGARIEVCDGHTTLIVLTHAPKVMHTVILGSFNRPKMVRDAIRSVKAQTRDDWQLIITDDGSNKETMRAIGAEISGDPRCEVIRYSGPSPQEGTRWGAQVRAIERINDALPHVRGELVHYLPDDDFYEPSRFEAFEAAFKDPRVNMVYGRLRWAHADGRPQHVSRDIFPGEPVTDPIGLLDHTQVVHRSMCLDVVNAWQTTDINYDSDGRFFKKLINAGFGPIRPMDKLVSYHREHGLNMIVIKDAITSKREP